jgi:hypothetical protein
MFVQVLTYATPVMVTRPCLACRNEMALSLRKVPFQRTAHRRAARLSASQHIACVAGAWHIFCS